MSSGAILGGMARDYGHELGFGVFITPDAGQANAVVELARLADASGLELVAPLDRHGFY